MASLSGDIRLLGTATLALDDDGRVEQGDVIEFASTPLTPPMRSRVVPVAPIAARAL